MANVAGKVVVVVSETVVLVDEVDDVVLDCVFVVEEELVVELWVFVVVDELVVEL